MPKSNKKLVEVGVLFVAVVFVYFFIPVQSDEIKKVTETTKEETKQQVKQQKIKLSFIGDLLMHGPQRKAGYNAEKETYDFDKFFKNVKPHFKTRDFVIGSLETSIIKEQKDSQYSGYPKFKSPPQYIKSIKNAGINTLVTANNHIVDYGSQGAIKTMQWLEKNNILYTGTYKTKEQRKKNPVLFLEKNNIKLAVMNYTKITNSISDKSYTLNYINYEKIKKDIEFANECNADKIIVWLHFGQEYKRYPGKEQKAIVKKVAELGADIIIGSHPHVIQPIKFIKTQDKKALVAYSLGNFISNQYWRYSTDGIILNLEIVKEKEQTKIKNINYIPTAVDRTYKGSEIKEEKTIKTSYEDYDYITYAASRGMLDEDKIQYRIVDVAKSIINYKKGNAKHLTQKDYTRLKTTWKDTTDLIGETKRIKIYNKINIEEFTNKLNKEKNKT